MAEDDSLKDSMRLALPQVFTLFLISFGSLLDFLVITDEHTAGRMSTGAAFFLRFFFIPPMLLSTLVNYFLVAHADPGFVGNKRIRGKREQSGQGDVSGAGAQADAESSVALMDKAERGDWLAGKEGAPVAEGKRLHLDMNSDYYDYCERCEVNLPLDRSIGHCHICDACVDGLDHHCPWIGQCIGRKNEKYFMRFNVSWALLLVQLVVVACWS
jgi:hypothetical protein